MTTAAITEAVAGSGAPDLSTTDISGAARTTEHTTVGRGRRGVRRGVLAAAATLALGVGGLGLASTASATVNPYGPHYTRSWGDCTLTIGNVKTPTGAAEGGLDIRCGHRHSEVAGSVTLWRYNGARWVAMTTSGWDAHRNTYGMSEWTAQRISCGGSAQWDDTATVNVDGNRTTLDLADGLGYYPRYAPPC